MHIFLLYSILFSASCLSVKIASVQPLFLLKPICSFYSCGSMTGCSLFSISLEYILPSWLRSDITLYWVHSLLLPVCFHNGIKIVCASLMVLLISPRLPSLKILWSHLKPFPTPRPVCTLAGNPSTPAALNCRARLMISSSEVISIWGSKINGAVCGIITCSFSQSGFSRPQVTVKKTVCGRDGKSSKLSTVPCRAERYICDYIHNICKIYVTLLC